ncbi:hypothetical protein ACIQ7N_23125 [Lysinibacillus sp. NPDC095746]|uniref:hypothetical protein n=1 Tax=unclassified Lysinibacillus TaxID=2636778 RepID=UPI0023639965|nr:hypothetical protein [Lysinibacillus sp. CNPSo 3705]MDD1501736.1 hypothetical protein [Lysinibacillus sp. CNPSo 3705]
MENKIVGSQFLKIFMVLVLALFPIFGVLTESTNAKENDEYLEELALIEDSLELIFDKGVVTNEKGYFLGYDRAVFENSLKKYDNYEEYIQFLEDEGLFVKINQIAISEKPEIGTRAVACGWHLMRPKAEYTAAQNKCIEKGLKDNYGFTTAISTIANLIADKEFKLAAEKIIKLGVKSNIWGVITTLSIINMNCGKEMDKLFPGKSNCE